MDIQALANRVKDTMVGFKYRHFKGGTYIVTDIAVHSESKEPMVVYANFDDPRLVWCRPLSMFLSEVDREKYPETKQFFRFEKID